MYLSCWNCHGLSTTSLPLLVGVYDDPDHISREIEQVTGLLTDAAEKLLPRATTEEG